MKRQALLHFAAAISALAVVTPIANGQVLVWSDEFDGASIDSTNWGHLFGNGCEYGNCGWGNNELQYYTTTTNNSFVSGGALHIVARRESMEGFSFTSARMHTRYRHNFLYGRLEASIKLPTGGGIWPAFWMMPADSVYGGWAASGEIDIMEMVNDAHTVHGTIHYGDNWPNNRSSGGGYAPGIDFSQDFHVYSIEWEPDEIRWYVDDYMYYSVTSDTWYSDAAPGNNRAPFDQPFYFLLNIAVGGNWPGCTNPGCITATFPQEMLVDWVRVYRVSPPVVTLTAPTAGAQLPPGTVNLTATAAATIDDATIARVEFYVDGALVGQDTTAPYAVAWNAAEGCHGVMARAVDSLDQTADTDTIAVTVGDGCEHPPYLGYPAPLPGRIEAENFDLGGANVSYHDTTSGNSGSVYRTTEDVDIEACSEGGYNIGWMASGEWLEYQVSITEPGTYAIRARVASQSDGGQFHVQFGDGRQSEDISVPVTGGWQSWTTVTGNVELVPGVTSMRFVNSNEDSEFNLNYFDVVLLYPRGDIDQDGDIDLADHGLFAACMAGPNVAAPPAGCNATVFDRCDLDNDGDVDIRDFAVTQGLNR